MRHLLPTVLFVLAINAFSAQAAEEDVFFSVPNSPVKSPIFPSKGSEELEQCEYQINEWSTQLEAKKDIPEDYLFTCEQIKPTLLQQFSLLIEQVREMRSELRQRKGWYPLPLPALSPEDAAIKRLTQLGWDRIVEKEKWLKSRVWPTLKKLLDDKEKITEKLSRFPLRQRDPLEEEISFYKELVTTWATHLETCTAAAYDDVSHRVYGDIIQRLVLLGEGQRELEYHIEAAQNTSEDFVPTTYEQTSYQEAEEFINQIIREALSDVELSAEQVPLRIAAKYRATLPSAFEEILRHSTLLLHQRNQLYPVSDLSLSGEEA